MLYPETNYDFLNGAIAGMGIGLILTSPLKKIIIPAKAEITVQLLN